MTAKKPKDEQRPEGAHAPDEAAAEEVEANSGPGPSSVESEPAPFGGDEVKEKLDAEQEQGYRGIVPDPTPNENYTVAGVTSGAPTPETDAEAFDESRKRSKLR